MQTRFFISFLGGALIAACSSTTTTRVGNSDDGGPSTTMDGATNTSTGLSCMSHTYCSSDEYKSYGSQTIPAATGGKIADGLYRSIYELASSSGTTGNRTEAFLFSKNQYLRIGDIGELGTYSVSGTNLTLTPTAFCESDTGVSDTPPASSTSSFSIEASGNFLRFDSAGVIVYAPVPDLCTPPNSPATTPGGDSLFCDVQNCGCAESVGGQADKQTCDFVSGR